MVVYSDASAKQNHLGAAAVTLDDNKNIVESRQVDIGPRNHWPIHAAELIGIYYSIELTKTCSLGNQCAATNRPLVTIISDSQSVPKAIANPAKRTNQQIIYAIFRAANNLKTQGISLRLQWIPGHCSNPGNDKADHLAKEAVGFNVSHPFQRSVNEEKRFYQDKILAEWETEWRSSAKG
jgi:ribonuclease HI